MKCVTVVTVAWHVKRNTEKFEFWKKIFRGLCKKYFTKCRRTRHPLRVIRCRFGTCLLLGLYAVGLGRWSEITFVWTEYVELIQTQSKTNVGMSQYVHMEDGHKSWEPCLVVSFSAKDYKWVHRSSRTLYLFHPLYPFLSLIVSRNREWLEMIDGISQVHDTVDGYTQIETSVTSESDVWGRRSKGNLLHFSHLIPTSFVLFFVLFCFLSWDFQLNIFHYFESNR